MFNSQCYSGMDSSGKLIFTPWFAEVCARHAGRAQAFDAAPEIQPDPHDRAREERNRELQATYDACRGNRAATVADVATMDNALFPGFDVRTHAAETIGRFKRTRGLDSLTDGECRRILQIEASYEDARRQSRNSQKLGAITFNGATLLMMLLACFLPALHAQEQPQPIGIYGSSAGVPPIGGGCTPIPFNSGVPNAYLTQAGQFVACEAGVWSVVQTFNSFQAGGTAVTMNGSDQTLYSVSLPPLRPGGCFAISYGIGAGLNTATLKLKIDGTTISQPFSTGSLTAVNVSLSGLQYCNLPASQANQSLIYLGGASAFLNFATPNSAWSYATGATGAENDPPVGTPSAVDWSVPHALTLTASQSGGSVTPQYLNIQGGR
jgi:hypothetical protein